MESGASSAFEGANFTLSDTEARILQVPTFLFYRGGKQTGRHVGSSRGDLMGQILNQQSALGIAPPPPPGSAPKRHSLRRR